MKKYYKTLALILALCLAFVLTACGESGTQSSGTAPSEEPAVSANDTPKSIAGNYRFEYADAYGDLTSFTITLKDDGTFTLMTLGAMGSEVYSGSEWTDCEDGTFITGATDITLATEFVGGDGAIVWRIEGENATPVDYVRPTEFLDKDAFSAPATGAEAVGVYTFGQINKFGSEVPYVLWVNADGTYRIFMNNSFTGLHEYYGDSWTISSASVLSLGPAYFDSDPPQGEWFDAETYASQWVLSGDGTCVPADYTESVANVDVSALPVEVLPTGYDKVGVYTFGQINKFGSAVPYVLWLNADGSADIFMINSFTGQHHYTAEKWSVDEDGNVAIGPVAYESDPPQGEWFSADTYESVWTVNMDGTCEPAGYAESKTDVDITALPDEIYPRNTSLAGVYYFGQINKFGSTVPYAIVLNEDSSALIVMDNAKTGVHAYKGIWSANGKTVTINDLTFESDPPQGEWFAEGTYDSIWIMEGNTCIPENYTGQSTTADFDSLSDAAAELING